MLSEREKVYATMRITELLQGVTDPKPDNHELLCAVYYLGREDEKNAKSVDNLRLQEPGGGRGQDHSDAPGE